MPVVVRPERQGDEADVHAVVQAAFLDAPHTGWTEPHIVDALRDAGALTVSLVADDRGVVGHVAASPVAVPGGGPWFGVGPVSVLPARQGEGIGATLMRAVVAELRARGAAGVVLLGDPAWYARFGFRPAAPLVLPDVPPEAFQVLDFGAPVPAGPVRYHEAFEARDPHLPATAWASGAPHPGARPGCPYCGGVGWSDVGARLVPRFCACVTTCPRCGDSGFLQGGLELCACRVARDRLALLAAAALPRPGGEPPPWCARYRPEPDQPWLLSTRPEAAVALGLARLVTAAAVPVADARSAPSTWRRVVVAWDLQTWTPAALQAVIDRCDGEGLTLVATAPAQPWTQDDRWSAALDDAALATLVIRSEQDAPQ